MDTTKHCRFLDLPAEVRNIVHDLSIDTHVVERSMSANRKAIPPPLMKVNKKLYAETITILRRKTIVLYDLCNHHIEPTIRWYSQLAPGSRAAMRFYCYGSWFSSKHALVAKARIDETYSKAKTLGVELPPGVVFARVATTNNGWLYGPSEWTIDPLGLVKALDEGEGRQHINRIEPTSC